MSQIALPDPSLIGNFPDKFGAFRPHQWDAIINIKSAFEDGARVVMAEAATGSGKSFIGEALRQWASWTATYTCTNHTLQRQFCGDFDYARELKGRRNYPTQQWAQEFPDITAEDCDLKEGVCFGCFEPQGCPYTVAKEEALSSPISVLNMAYLLAESNMTKSRFSDNSDLIIIDEADTIESQLMNTIELSVSTRLLDQMIIPPPPRSGQEHADQWGEWMEIYLHPGLVRYANSIIATSGPEGKRERKRKAYLHRTAQKVQRIIDHGDIAENWIYEGPSERSRKQYDRLTFRPIRVGEWAEDYLWRHSKRFLLMSATILSGQQMADDLGLGSSDYRFVRVDYSFPIARRPVRFWGTQGLRYTRATEADGSAYADMMPKLTQILNWYRDERILVHSVSHARTRTIVAAMTREFPSRPIFWFESENTKEARQKAISDYESTPGAVLIGAGLERGIDLPGDLCRVVVVTKVPFPNLGDKQVAARKHSMNGQSWFMSQAIRSMVQMTGRGMRSKDDWCVSYILDDSFRGLMTDSRWKQMLPPYWRTAVRVGAPTGREPVESV